MATVAIYPSPSHEAPLFPYDEIAADNNLAQRLISYVWKHYNYALTQCDAEDIMYTDMWGSIEEFIEYMQQFDGAGELTTSDHKSSLYSTAELDAMDAGILPSGPDLCSLIQGSTRSECEKYLGTDDEDEDFEDSESGYNDELLPRYQGDERPTYWSPVPSYQSICAEYFGSSASASVSSLELSSEESDLPEAVIEETSEPEVKIGHSRFSQLRPRFMAKLQRVKQSFSSSSSSASPAESKRVSEPKPSRANTLRVREKLSQAKQDIAAKRVSATRKLESQLSAVSPRRAIRRARHFVTLGRC
jgi:hypothetical protein